MESTLRVGNTNSLVNESNEMQDELDYIVKSIKNIYETFDELKESWKGEKADKNKAILESARQPLTVLCEHAQMRNDALKDVGKILSDYRNKG